MKLTYRAMTDEDLPFLYFLLGQREKTTNISHVKMPTMRQHITFWKGDPYPQMEIIMLDAITVGYWYLTDRNEIGLFVEREWQGQGFGRKTLKHILQKNKGKRLLANINPTNYRSANLFEGEGFKHIQNTFAYGG